MSPQDTEVTVRELVARCEQECRKMLSTPTPGARSFHLKRMREIVVVLQRREKQVNAATRLIGVKLGRAQDDSSLQRAWDNSALYRAYVQRARHRCEAMRDRSAKAAPNFIDSL